jgi:IQ calmodulin-binding motif
MSRRHFSTAAAASDAKDSPLLRVVSEHGVAHHSRSNSSLSTAYANVHSSSIRIPHHTRNVSTQLTTRAALRRAVSTQGDTHPLRTRTAAAIQIQRVWRGHLDRRFVVNERRRKQKREKYTIFELYLMRSGTDLLQLKHRPDTPMPAKVVSAFYHWCATYIQAAWFNHKRRQQRQSLHVLEDFKMHRRGRRARRWSVFAGNDVYNIAAQTIQKAWFRYYDSLSVRRFYDNAARVIQHAWGRFSDRRIFAYFKTLLLERQQRSDAVTLLKMLNPKESALLDRTAGLYVRFRFGGTEFPPQVYYKIFTSQNVTDIGAFAPRVYADKEAFHNPETWYRRKENNGWRPLCADIVGHGKASVDDVTARTASKERTFHHSKLMRRREYLHKRKTKRIRWMTAL